MRGSPQTEQDEASGAGLQVCERVVVPKDGGEEGRGQISQSLRD